MSGQNESAIAALLRHSTTALVRRYAHLNQPHLKQAVESVAGFGKEPVKPIVTGEIEAETGKNRKRRVRLERGTGSLNWRKSASLKGKRLVPPIRIERTTYGLGNRCSIQLSYGGVG